MTQNQSLDSSLAVRSTTAHEAPVPRIAGVAGMLRRRLQAALFPLVDSKYPALTHALRLRYNLTLRQGEAELQYVRFLVDRSRVAADIGAHRGVYAHVLARYAKHVHAFEPHPQLFTYLRRVMSDQVTVHPVALSAAAGTVTFRIPRAGSYLGLGQGTLEDLPIFHGAGVSEIEVRSSTLDQEVREPVGFMKIDVEGHEVSVLEGARDLLRKDQPALMIEIADGPELQHYQRVVDFLAGFGYRPFWLDRGALVSAARRGPGAAFFRGEGPKGEVLCANFIFLA